MKKVLNYLWKHKLFTLFLIICLVVLIFLIKIVLIFTESDEQAFYGTRLSEESKYEIKLSDTKKKVSEKLGDQVKSVVVRKQGRIINIIIKVNDDASRDFARDLGNQAISVLSEEEKGYYDVQVFLNKDNEEGENHQFPVVGYKHHTKDGINWTRDR